MTNPCAFDDVVLSADVEREYVYRPGWMMILLCGSFFIGCGVVLGDKALRNEQGLVINGIIQLGPTGATIFYWTLCILSFGFVVAAGLCALHRIITNQRLAFTSDAILLPFSRWSSKEIAIPYDEIVKLSSVEISGQRILYLYRNNNTKFTIAASMLPSRESFDEVCVFLEKKIDSAVQDA